MILSTYFSTSFCTCSVTRYCNSLDEIWAFFA